MSEVLERQHLLRTGHLDETERVDRGDHASGAVPTDDGWMRLDDQGPYPLTEQGPLPLHEIGFGAFDVHDETQVHEPSLSQELRQRGVTNLKLASVEPAVRLQGGDQGGIRCDDDVVPGLCQLLVDAARHDPDARAELDRR